MIQSQTYLNVADNSGARTSTCIRILRTSNCKCANIGDAVIAVVKEVVPNMSIKKSEIIRAVIIRTRKGLKRKNGTVLEFDDNAAIVVNQEGNPRGTRVFGPVTKELRGCNLARIVSLASEVL
nr:ribosomal protein L14 [Actinostachys digitata]